MIKLDKDEFKRLKEIEKLLKEELKAKDMINRGTKKLRKVNKQKREIFPKLNK